MEALVERQRRLSCPVLSCLLQYLFYSVPILLLLQCYCAILLCVTAVLAIAFSNAVRFIIYYLRCRRRIGVLVCVFCVVRMERGGRT